MTQDTFNDASLVKRTIKCAPMYEYSSSWDPAMHANMAGMIAAPRMEFFEDLIDKVAAGPGAEQAAAKITIAQFNSYIGALLDRVKQSNGDTYDAIGVAQNASMAFERDGVLPGVDVAASVLGNKEALFNLGIAKPWTEYLETEKAFQDRLEANEADRARKIEKSKRVVIEMPAQRKSRTHNATMTLSLRMPEGFEDAFSRDSTHGRADTNEVLRDLNAALHATAGAGAAKVERKIYNRTAVPAGRQL